MAVVSEGRRRQMSGVAWVAAGVVADLDIGGDQDHVGVGFVLVTAVLDPGIDLAAGAVARATKSNLIACGDRAHQQEQLAIVRCGYCRPMLSHYGRRAESVRSRGALAGPGGQRRWCCGARRVEL